MADPIKRLNYFEGEFLHADDFNDEQKYHKEMRRLHNSLLHTWGIARGLNLSFAQGASHATIREGVAVDGMGREIMLAADTETPDLPANKTVYVTITYGEQQTDSTSETGVTGNTRWTETPVLEVSENPPGDAGQKLILGRVTVGGDGKITNIDEGMEPNRRHSAGVVGGDLEVRSLTLADPNIDPTGWSKLRLGAARRADVQSSLKIEGDIEVTGKVDGRDVSADGARLDAHVAATNNPHQTTAAQVGALTGLKGVANPGGSVDLAPADLSKITVTADAANKRVVIGESHSALTNNPHQTTAAQIDSQGGTNQIVTQINAGSGSINAERIDSAIARVANTKPSITGATEQVPALDGSTITLASVAVTATSSGRIMLTGSGKVSIAQEAGRSSMAWIGIGDTSSTNSVIVRLPETSAAGQYYIPFSFSRLVNVNGPSVTTWSMLGSKPPNADVGGGVKIAVLEPNLIGLFVPA